MSVKEALTIADCRLPIGFNGQRSIDNRQLTIGNVEAHPLPRGGTDCIHRKINDH